LVVNKEETGLVPVFSLILSSCRVHGRERPVWSCGVVDWFSRPLNEQPVAWSDSWSQMGFPILARVPAQNFSKFEFIHVTFNVCSFRMDLLVQNDHLHESQTSHV